VSAMKRKEVIDNSARFGFKLSELEKREALAAIHSRRWSQPVALLAFNISRSTLANLRYSTSGMYRAAFAEMDADKDAFITKYLIPAVIKRMDDAAVRYRRLLNEQALERAKQRVDDYKRAVGNA
jgi:hypothetical protein